MLLQLHLLNFIVQHELDFSIQFPLYSIFFHYYNVYKILFGLLFIILNFLLTYCTMFYLKYVLIDFESIFSSNFTRSFNNVILFSVVSTLFFSHRISTSFFFNPYISVVVGKQIFKNNPD